MGERIGSDAEQRLHAALAEAICEACVLPIDFDVRHLASPDLSGGSVLDTEPLPLAQAIGRILDEHCERWDRLAGTVQRLTAPVAFPRIAGGACIRLIVIDVAIRIACLLSALEVDAAQAIIDLAAGIEAPGLWLRSLVKLAAPLTRLELADELEVHENSVDGWLDKDVRPSDEHLGYIADALADRQVGSRASLIRGLRFVYGGHELFNALVHAVGNEQAPAIARRATLYARNLLTFATEFLGGAARPDLLRTFRNGTLESEPAGGNVLNSMLHFLWAREADPVWRTSIKAVRRPWIEHLQEVTAMLGEPDVAQFAAEFGEPTRERLVELAYQTQATTDELAQDPRLAIGIVLQSNERGPAGALALKLHAVEAANRGDRKSAIELLRAALSRDPFDPEIRFRLGCSLWQTGHVAKGLLELEIAIQLDGTWDAAWTEVGIVLINEGREEEALRKLLAGRAAVQPPSWWLTFNLAYALERTGQIEGAIASYEETLTLRADNAEALDRLAHLYFRVDDQRRGAERAKRAAHLGVPTVFNAWREGVYRKAMPTYRPPHVGLDGIVHFPDSAWRG